MQHVHVVIEQMLAMDMSDCVNLGYFLKKAVQNGKKTVNGVEVIIPVIEELSLLDLRVRWMRMTNWMVSLMVEGTQDMDLVLGIGLRRRAGKFEWNLWLNDFDLAKLFHRLPSLLHHIFYQLYPAPVIDPISFVSSIVIISSNGYERSVCSVSDPIVFEFKKLAYFQPAKVAFEIPNSLDNNHVSCEFLNVDWEQFINPKFSSIPEEMFSELTNSIANDEKSKFSLRSNSILDSLNQATYEIQSTAGSIQPSISRQFNIADIQSMIGPFREFFTASVIDVCTPEYAQLLGIEGCPKCLQGPDILHSPNIADSIIQHGACVILKCNAIDCQHVIHVACLFLNAPHVPTLHRYHCSTFFRVVPLPDSEPNPALEGDIVRGSRKCSVEFEMSHLLSNAQILRIEYARPFDTSMERAHARIGQESIIRNLNPEKHRVFFAVLRGRIIFKCVDSQTGEEFLHDANYSLEDVPPNVAHMRLILVDPGLKHTLSIGIRRRPLDFFMNQAEPSLMVSDFYVAYIRYDLLGSSYLPQPRSSRPSQPNSAALVPSLPEKNVNLPLPVTSTPFQFGTLQAAITAPPFVPSNFVPIYANDFKDNQFAGDHFRGSSASVTSAPWSGGTAKPAVIAGGKSSFAGNDGLEYEDDGPLEDFTVDYASETPRTEAIAASRFALQEELRLAYLESLPVPNPLDSIAAATGIVEIDDFLFAKGIRIGNLIDYVVGRVFLLAQGQGGSRFLMQILDEGEVSFFRLLFQELKVHVTELAVDPYGHFVIEKLFQKSSEVNRLELLKLLLHNLIDIACHRQGSFTLQMILPCLVSDEEIGVFCSVLEQDLVRLLTNSNAYLLLLRFMQHFHLPKCFFILECIEVYCLDIAIDHHGLKVVKTCIDIIPPRDLHGIYKAIARFTMKLAENQYGNYCIQHVLDHAPLNVCIQLKKKMEGKYVRLAKQKFSSNVVEKCLRTSNLEWRGIILRELTASVGELIRDRYGNYVLQTAVSLADAAQLAEFTKSASPYLSQLRDNVRTKWYKILKTAAAAVSPLQASVPAPTVGSTSVNKNATAAHSGLKK